MRKELIVCIVIVFLIIIGNTLTQNYSKQSIQGLCSDLELLKTKLSENDVIWEQAKKEYDDISVKWRETKNIMSYFIEHDELEKVETNLVGLKSFIDMEDEKEAVAELNRGVFVLRHIEDKNSLNLRNIF